MRDFISTMNDEKESWYVKENFISSRGYKGMLISCAKTLTGAGLYKK